MHKTRDSHAAAEIDLRFCQESMRSEKLNPVSGIRYRRAYKCGIYETLKTVSRLIGEMFQFGIEVDLHFFSLFYPAR